MRSSLAAVRAAGTELAYRAWLLTGGRSARLERPIFMLGCPRSGTTVAVDLFARHPDVANLSEAQEIWDPRGHLDPEADHHWTAADVKPEDARRLHTRFEFHRRLHRKARFVNKNPRSSVRIDYIRAVFPDAVFLHVLRDGRAVAHSILREMRRDSLRQRFPFGNFCKPPHWRQLLRDDPAEQAALQWTEVVRYVRGHRQTLADSYHEFRYEDFCQNPRQVLAHAYGFAGLRVDEEVLKRLPARLDSQNFQWRASLQPTQIETINRIQKELLVELGYEL
jgi:hypothetical protein